MLPILLPAIKMAKYFLKWLIIHLGLVGSIISLFELYMHKLEMLIDETVPLKEFYIFFYENLKKKENQVLEMNDTLK